MDDVECGERDVERRVGGGGGGAVVTDRFTPLGIELKSHLVKLNHGVNES